MPTDRRCADFIGAWQVDRQIIPASGPAGQFTGRAVWTATSQGAQYVETGALRLGTAAPMQAERRYTWQGLDVYFDDGRFFHRVPSEGGAAEHWCDPDMYRVAYDFSDWPVFTTTWRVLGPRKDYETRTIYTREGTASQLDGGCGI